MKIFKLKIVRIVLAAMLVALLSFAAVACFDSADSGDDSGHTHSYGTAWEYSATQHWHECACGNKSDTANHSYDGEICTVCGYEKGGSTSDTAEMKPASNYFSGASLSYVNNAISDTALGGTKDFYVLLERQIDAVAQELLVRLGKVYGQVDANVYQVKDGSQDFTGLTVAKENVIVEPDRYGETTGNPIYDRKAGGTANVHEKIDLDDPATYAFNLSAGSYYAEYLSGAAFNFRNAIQGGYVYNGNVFTDNYRDNKSWRMSYLGDFNIDNYVATYLNTVKTGIANVIAGTEFFPLDTVDELGDAYTWAVREIDRLGFTAQDIENTIQYVNNFIIGEDVLIRDNNQKPTVNTISSATELTNLQHEFKNYEVIVPAIVNSTLTHKLESGNGAYFSAEKVTSNENASLTDSNNNYAEYTSITLKATANTPITKLVVKTKANASDAFYSFRLKMTIGSETVDVTPTNGFYASSNELEFTINLAAKFPSLASTKLNAGDTIKLDFEPVSATSKKGTFRMEFVGYWNRNA